MGKAPKKQLGVVGGEGIMSGVRQTTFSPFFRLEGVGLVLLANDVGGGGDSIAGITRGKEGKHYGRKSRRNQENLKEVLRVS